MSKRTVSVCTSHEFLHLKSHQGCSAGIRTWLSTDYSSSSIMTESIIIFLTLPYTKRHCYVRIEKGPVQTVAIQLEVQHFRLSLYALTKRFVPMEKINAYFYSFYV